MGEREHRLKLTNDLVFKAVYGSDDDRSRAALISMLNLILQREENPIVSVEIKNPINYATYRADKASILDIRCKTNSGEMINVEMQVKYRKGIHKRIVFYQAKNISRMLKVKQEYANMNKTISICIAVDDCLQDTDSFHSIFRYKNIETGQELTDISEIQFVELGKIDETKLIAEMTELERYGLFLLYANEEGKEEYVEELKAFGDEVIHMSDAILRKYTEEEILAELAEDREMFLFEQEIMKMEQEETKKEYEATKKEYEAMKIEQEAMKIEQEAMKIEQEAMKIEQEAMKKEKETLEKALAENKAELAEKKSELAENKAELAEKKSELAQKDKTIAQNKVERATIAKKLKLAGLSAETIAECVGISIEQINQL